MHGRTSAQSEWVLTTRQSFLELDTGVTGGELPVDGGVALVALGLQRLHPLL